MAQLPTRKVCDTKYETSLKDLEESLKLLHSKKKEWAASPFAERMEMARDMVARLRVEMEIVAKAACEYKGVYGDKHGEEMLFWVIGTNFMLDAAETLKVLDTKKAPITRLKSLGPKASEGIIDVFPMTWYDPFLMPGSRGQVYLKSGDTVPVSGKAVLEGHGGEGELCAILGAGNVSSINVSDVINKALLEGCVCCLKLNPVNEYVGPSVERALAPLIERGALRVVYGGGPVGKALVEHPLVDSVHMTGSDRTYDAVVWQGKPKTGTPPLTKPVSAELGCVSPVVICPGEWSDNDLRLKAEEICRNVASNASCNCLANKVIVTSAGWPQREAFLQKLREGFAKMHPRAVYYPGSMEKLAAFRAAYPAAEALHIGSTLPEGCGPYVLNVGLDASKDEVAFREEPWATVLSEVPLKAETVPDFLESATQFCNNKLWGTLSATIFIHPREEKAHGGALSRFLREMRYGAVAVNTQAGLIMTMPAATWGGFPGHTPADIQSGVGIVRNSLLIENVEKSVVFGPWGASARLACVSFEALSRGLNTFYGELKKDGQPKWFNLVRLVWAVLTGWAL